MSRNWKSKSQLGTVWNPKVDANGAPRFEATEEDFIEGTYVDRKDNVGQYNSTVYNIQSDDGEIQAVWGDTVLNGEMNKYKFGMYLKIKFAGRKRKKDVKDSVPMNDKNSFWNWEVFYDDSTGEPVSANDVNDAISTPSLTPGNNSLGDSNGSTDDLPF